VSTVAISPWAQRRKDALRVHYSGALSWRYVATGERTIIKRNPVCSAIYRQPKTSCHLHAVTCKRCLFLIDLAAHNNGGPLEIPS
jgi:hypothetical protein